MEPQPPILDHAHPPVDGVQASLGGALWHAENEGVPDKVERLWAALAHLSFGMLGIVGPLLLLFASEAVVGRDSAFVKHAAKQALIWQLASLLLLCTVIGPIIMLVFAGLAGFAAYKGRWYIYPSLARFVDR